MTKKVFSTPIKEAVFTVFDFETTGLYPYAGDRICEIGALKIHPSGDIDKFHSMVDPGREISRGAFLVNGITSDMVRGAPDIKDILPDFIKFIEGTILVAYNAGFDIGFLEFALEDDKDILNSYQVIDALLLARKLFTWMKRFNLGSVAHALNIPIQRQHRASADAFLTLEVFKKELELLIDDGAKAVNDIAFKAVTIKRVSKVRDYKLEIIKKAIETQKKLDIIYQSQWSNKTSRRTITPMEIQKGYDKNYLVAYCHLREDKRNFRLDGIVDIKLEKER